MSGSLFNTLPPGELYILPRNGGVRTRFQKHTHDDLLSIVSFMDADRNHVPIPDGAVLKRKACDKVVPPVGQVFVLVWSESYMLFLDGRHVVSFPSAQEKAMSNTSVL